jgi:hypothetical protein
LGRTPRLGDNAGVAGDDSKAQVKRAAFMLLLDGTRPSGALEWVSPVAPAVTQIAVGAGHWAAGRRQRALAAWASAAGFGLVAWGLGTEAPTRAEVEHILRQQRDLLRKPDTTAPLAVLYGLRVPRAVQRRRPRIAAGSALVAAGAIARLRASSAEPLR